MSKNKKQRNLALLIALTSIVFILYGVAFLRVSGH